MGIINYVRTGGLDVEQWVEAGKPPEKPLAGYIGFDKYPTKFQAVEFPTLGKETRITGNNQAFFFTEGVKGADGKAYIGESTTKLRELITNIVKQGDTAETRPSVRLQIDADLFENKDRFVDKYQALRAEPDEATRRELLGTEVNIIRNFVQRGGIKALIEDVLQKNAIENGNPPLSGKALEEISEKFFEKNFRLEGVKTQGTPLQFATWEVNTTDGVLLARQEYKNSTHMTERPWQLGTQEELSQLANAGHPGAQQVLEAAAHTRNLETVDLTFGQAQAPRIEDGKSR